MKPTEGHWRTEAVSDAVRVVVGEGRKKIILARLCPPQLPELETHANAKLMSAAPELLSLLKEIVADEQLRELMKEPDCNDCGSTLNRAQAAIAKAEGKKYEVLDTSQKAKCNGCGFTASPEDFEPSMSPYHDLKCPKCGTTNIDWDCGSYKGNTLDTSKE